MIFYIAICVVIAMIGVGTYTVLQKKADEAITSTTNQVVAGAIDGVTGAIGGAAASTVTNVAAGIVTGVTNVVGSTPLQCPPGTYANGALCTMNCDPGESSDGLGNCYAGCPAGWDSTPTTCTKPAAYGRGVGRALDLVCGPGSEEYAGVCVGNNYNHAVWSRSAICSIFNNQNWSSATDCGIYGPQPSLTSKTCHATGEDRIGDLCYPTCAPGFHAVGNNICSPDCPPGFADFGAGCTRIVRNAGENKGILEVGVCPSGQMRSVAGTGCVPDHT
jgi:hypothetical protein